MNPTRSSRWTILAAALLLPACDLATVPEDPTGPLAFLGERRDAWGAADRGAQAAYEAGRWEESAARHREKIALYPSAAPGEPLPEVVEALLRRDLYNLACCLALAGRKGEALDALERCFRDGSGEIGFDHLVQDPDLEALHGEVRWKELVRILSDPRAYSATESFVEESLDGVVELRATDAEINLRPDEVLTSAWIVRPFPPYLLDPNRSSWTTRLDPGARAADATRAMPTKLAKGVPGARLVLKASGPEMVRVAWEVLLRRPEAFTHAVLDGPAPPARVLLDRGADKVKAVILVADAAGVPDARVGVKVEVAGSADEALRRALR